MSVASENYKQSLLIFQAIIAFFKDILLTKTEDQATIADLREQLDIKTQELVKAQEENGIDAEVSEQVLAQVREFAAIAGLATPSVEVVPETPVESETPTEVIPETEATVEPETPTEEI